MWEGWGARWGVIQGCTMVTCNRQRFLLIACIIHETRPTQPRRMNPDNRSPSQNPQGVRASKRVPTATLSFHNPVPPPSHPHRERRENASNPRTRQQGVARTRRWGGRLAVCVYGGRLVWSTCWGDMQGCTMGHMQKQRLHHPRDTRGPIQHSRMNPDNRNPSQSPGPGIRECAQTSRCQLPPYPITIPVQPPSHPHRERGEDASDSAPVSNEWLDVTRERQVGGCG